MSMRVDSGYRLPENVNVFEFLRTVKKPLQDTFVALHAREIVRAAVSRMDNYTFGFYDGEDALESPLFTIGEEAVAKFAADDSYLNCTVTVADHRGSGRAYAVLMNGIYDEYRETFERAGDVEPFYYSGIIEAPDGVSDGQWDERAVIWKETLTSFYVKHSGWSWSVVDTFPMFPSVNIDQYADFIPSVQERAVQVVRMRHMHPAGSDMPIEDMKKKLVWFMLEGKSQVREEAQKLEVDLPEITVEQLFGKWWHENLDVSRLI